MRSNGKRRRGKPGFGEPSPKKEPWERDHYTAPQGFQQNRAAGNCTHPGVRRDLNLATLNYPRHQVTPPFRQPRWRTLKPGGVSIPNLLTQLPPQPGGTIFSPPIPNIGRPTSSVKLPLEIRCASRFCPRPQGAHTGTSYKVFDRIDGGADLCVRLGQRLPMQNSGAHSWKL
jgi:hypothetical protein